MDIINSISVGGTVYALTSLLGLCPTAAATAAKVVTLSFPAGFPFELISGVRIVVQFTEANSVRNPTLNVAGTGAMPIYFHGTSLTTALNWWAAGQLVEFMFDGSYWQMLGSPYNADTNTDTKVTQTVRTTDEEFPILLRGTSAGTTTTTTTASFAAAVTINPSTGTITATSFVGDGSGLTTLNASNISSGTLAAARLPSSGVTASSYGPSANASPAHSGTFSVPYITVDAYGRVTAASTKTITLPADNNTDTKVTQSATTASSFRPLVLGTTYSSTVSELTTTVTGQTYLSEKLYVKPSTGALYATDFYTTATNHGYYAVDSSGTAYRCIGDNGTNLWIGSTETAATHHIGKTYISAGHNGTSGNSTIYVSVPNAANNGGANYEVLHKGNLVPYTLTSSTSTTPSSGTIVWYYGS